MPCYNPSVDERAYVERRRPEWEQLAKILGRASSGLKGLSGNDLTELSKLYRRLTSDLSYVTANSTNQELITYLNELAGRAHGYLYADVPKNPLHSFRSFLLSGFPILFRKKKHFIAASLLIMLAGTFFSAIAVTIEPKLAYNYYPAEYGKKETSPTEHTPNPAPATFSSFLMTHNIQVSFTVFAGGITFGILTVIELLQNGLMLGAFAANAPPGLKNPLDWCAYIFPHGFIELSAIIIAGAAGLMLGWALIAPGNLTRWDALRRASREAIPLMGGVVVMLVIAGILESCVARTTVPRELKLCIAATTALGLIAYFGWAGSSAPKDQGTQVI